MKHYLYLRLNAILVLLMVSLNATSSDLIGKIDSLIKGKRMTVGVATECNGVQFTFNDSLHFPLLSVFKVHVAMAAVDKMQNCGISADSIIHISKKQLHPNTYSPLKQAHPNSDINITLAELLKYSVALSDNNACDILFDRFGGPEAADKFIRGLGLQQFAIEVTEDEMHKDLDLCYRNWTTPLEAARLLELFISGKAVQGVFRDFIEKTMLSCRTGEDRLPAPLVGADAVIGHKTGSGDRNAAGRLIGTNDIGFVFLPDGRHYTIAVLVKDSEEDARATSRIIADVSEAVYERVCGAETDG